MALCLISSIAVAKTPLEKPLAEYQANGRAAELEPNNDHLTANALTVGDDMSAAIDPAGDVDYFSIAMLTGDCLVFETHPGDAGDTKLYVFDVDGISQLAYDDDGGEGWYSLITFEAPADGTYFVEVTGYSSSTSGTYILTATDCPEPPNCDDAIDLQAQGLDQFVIDLCAMPSEWSGEYGDCTGYADGGNEALYKIYLTAGETFSVTEDGTHDMSMYLVTDCSDIIANCVAGSDSCCSGAQEVINYVAAADGWYYLFVDGYSGCSEVTVTIAAPIANEDSDWGGVKSLYR